MGQDKGKTGQGAWMVKGVWGSREVYGRGCTSGFFGGGEPATCHLPHRQSIRLTSRAFSLGPAKCQVKILPKNHSEIIRKKYIKHKRRKTKLHSTVAQTFARQNGLLDRQLLAPATQKKNPEPWVSHQI